MVRLPSHRGDADGFDAGISISVAMNLLGHKTDIMFRRYIQKHGDRLLEAATRLARRPKESSGIRTVTEAFTEAKRL